MNGERIPVMGAELENRDRLVHPAEKCVLLLEHLHDNPGTSPVPQKGRARMLEIRVGVVPLTHLLHREVEDLRRQPFADLLLDGHYFCSSCRQAASAASATSTCSRVGSAVASRC